MWHCVEILTPTGTPLFLGDLRVPLTHGGSYSQLLRRNLKAREHATSEEFRGKPRFLGRHFRMAFAPPNDEARSPDRTIR